MITTSITYDHRGRAKNGEGSVEIRIINDRKPVYINTGVRVKPDEFSAGSIVNHPKADELQKRIDAVYKAVCKQVDKYIAEKRPLNIASIRTAVWSNTIDDGNDFLHWFSEQLPLLSVGNGTLRHYKVTYARVCACECFHDWEDLTIENIYKFDAYLHSLPGSAEGHLNQGTIYNHHKDLKAIISRAVRMGMCDFNPYMRLRGQIKRGDNETVSYLTEEEVQQFISVQPTGLMQATAKDIFIFQLYTGLSYSDVQSFRIEDYKHIDGRWVNVGRRIKTGVPYISQLLPPAVEVLERNGMCVPRLSNQKYNQALKELGKAAGINAELHSHIARHTFATWMLRNGVRIENLARMLGHTNIKQTQRYAKVLAESVHEDFDKISEMLKNQKL